MTFSHQLIQLSIIIGHFSSCCFTPLSKIPHSLTKGVPIFWKAPTTLIAGILQLGFTHQGTQKCFYLEMQSHSHPSRGPAEPEG